MRCLLFSRTCCAFLLSLLLITKPFIAKAQQTYFYADQVDTILQNLDKSYVTTGVLYDRAFPLSRFDVFNPATDTATYQFATQAYYELYQAHYDRSVLLDPSLLFKMIDWENIRARVPILILDYQYNKLDTMAVDENLLSLQNGYLYDVAGRSRSPYWLQRFQLATPLTDTLTNSNVLFNVQPIFISRNTGLDVQTVVADFGDGTGQHTLNGALDSLNIFYSTNGEKVVTIQVTLSDGSSFQTKNKIIVNATTNNNSRTMGTDAYAPCYPEQVIADMAYKGLDDDAPYNGRFTVNYYYRTNDGTACDGSKQHVKKPVIVIDGFDPTDKRDASKIYQQFLFYVDDVNYPPNPPTYKDLVRTLRDQGYDVIIVDIPTYVITGSGQYLTKPANSPHWPNGWTYMLGKVIRGGGDYVQRNAFTLVKLINNLNQDLASQGSTEQLVIVGPSMGGQISRYALRWMELNGQNHNCRLWVSFDSNHEGAVLPIGEQYFIDYLAGASAQAYQARENQINVPAAKQFLIDHYLYHANGDLNPGGAPNYYQNYYNEINSLGWPQNCRKIAMISGAENGSAQNTPQGSQLAYEQIIKNNRKGLLLILLGAAFQPDLTLLDAKIYVAPAPSQGTSKVFEASSSLLMGILKGLHSKTNYGNPSPLCRTQSLETIQGGYYWGYDELEGTSGGDNSVVKGSLGTSRQYINNYSHYHTHQPTFNTLAIGLPGYPNYNRKWDDDISNVNLVCETHEIPFDAYYGPTTFNVRHDSLFYWQTQYLIGEINKTPMPLKKFNETISGDNTTTWCAGSLRTFQILSPKQGQTFTWITSNPNLVIQSGQGTPVIQVQYTGGVLSSGQYINLQTTHPCFSDATINLPLQMSFGTPYLTSAQYTYNGSQNPLQYYSGPSSYNPLCTSQNTDVNATFTGANTVTWSKVSSSATVAWYQNGNDLNFYLWAAGQTAVFNVQASNGCGNVNYSFGFQDVNCGGGGGGCMKYIVTKIGNSSLRVVKPDIPPGCRVIQTPKDKEDYEKETISQIRIYDISGKLRQENSFGSVKEALVNTNGLISGVYLIEISDGKTSERQLITIMK